MDIRNKSWMNLPRASPIYIKGVDSFLDFAFRKTGQGKDIACPCKKCCNRYWLHRETVKEHLIVVGFVKGYTEWVFHGEGLSIYSEDLLHHNEGLNPLDDMNEMLHDLYSHEVRGDTNNPSVIEGPNVEAKKFYKLIEEGRKELYPGCKKFSRLSFTIRLYLFKCLHGISNVAFGDLLDLLKDAFPEAIIPNSFNEAKKIVKDLGLDYKKIHACPNDCMLFMDEHENASNCLKCGTSRWKLEDICEGENNNRIPAKVLRYFPLTPRLQRLFMCEETANAMKWHAMNRSNDGGLRHPADAIAWKEFDKLHPEFAKDPRNVRLALASDGFNPFRTMSISHSTWPVVLVNYNLSPLILMKPEYLILSTIISGPKSPSQDIDIYLQPLIKELKDLWENGIETYDSATKQNFRMRVALLWTISDFSAYAMLSGWSTKGKFACPHCNYDTCSQYLKYSRKMCYMGHRRFLDKDHPWRHNKTSFNGDVELREAPVPLSGIDVAQRLSKFENSFGKTQKKKPQYNNDPWRKRSIFFYLPYWQYNILRHNLDVMHIQKNVWDNVLGTLLNMVGRTKDHLNARLDLQAMGIRKELHPTRVDAGSKVQIAKACYSMTPQEKTLFCTVFNEVKLPQGFASNISRCVQLKDNKISGYKSHDAHVMMNYLLGVAVRKTLPKNVAIVLLKLSDYFRCICSKVVKIEDLENMHKAIVEILCRLEMTFNPSFFYVMVHLIIHLVDEIKLGGPVHCRWMFPIEQYLCKLKSYVRNRSHPEGSIAEGYLAEECLIFCSRYMQDGVRTMFSRYEINGDIKETNEEASPIFPEIGHPIVGKKRNKGKAFTLDAISYAHAHRYVVFNCGDQIVDGYIEEHLNQINSNSRLRRWERARIHSEKFIIWFQERVKNENVPSYIMWLSKGPNPIAIRYTGYSINGYRFHTRKRDSRFKTQNSGVTLQALTPSFASARDQNPIVGNVTYYGEVDEIIKIDFWGKFRVVLFKCVWYQEEKDEYGLTCVNFQKLCYANDPFVMASQVQQVFYIKDPIEEGLHYVMKRFPRDLYGTQHETYQNIDQVSVEDLYSLQAANNLCTDAQFSCAREGEPVETIDIPLNISEVHGDDEMVEDDSDIDDTEWDWMDVDE